MTLYIAGHTGLVGSALLRRFTGRPGVRVVTTPRAETDLTDPVAVGRWMRQARPDLVILAAGRVGGIRANSTYPAEFIYENLMIETTVIHAAWRSGVRRLLNFGSGCMYPRVCPQPMRPEQLMTGPMEPTSGPYAVAKLAGLALCAAYNQQHGTRYLSVIPCTVYGPDDSFDRDDAHVLPALLRRFHEAKVSGARAVTVWGTGGARRDFIYADDLAEACERLLSAYEGPGPVNIGPGAAVTIRELAEQVAATVGFQGALVWDAARPSGAPEKRLDPAVIQALGWRPRTTLAQGLADTYRWYLEHEAGPARRESACASS